MEQRIAGITRDSFAEWFIIGIIVKSVKDGQSVREIPGMEDFNLRDFNVEFKINGVDFDFLTMMERMKENYDRAVADGAKAVVQDKLDEIEGEFQGLMDKVCQMTMRELREKVNLQEEE